MMRGELQQPPFNLKIMKMKVLNLYAGIGGNRKLWEGVEVTAVEYNEAIANTYKKFHPNDTVIIGDAHEYLLNHYEEFDFIWASPPCPTHSKIAVNFANAEGQRRRNPKYPDMKLYQEIIFLDAFFKGLWVVENVTPYYEPLIPAKKVGRHLFWSNFKIGQIAHEKSDKILRGDQSEKYAVKGFDLSEEKGFRKDQVINNCVLPETGLYILNCARGIKTQKESIQQQLF
jgi:DNA (cytosine-5)-methyltransferase 1